MKLQRLNHDNAWALTLGGVVFLIDPWLWGPEVDVAPWFNIQWHAASVLPADQVVSFDAVILTQHYPDHMHLPTLRRLGPHRLFGPQSCGRTLRRAFPHAETTLLSNRHGLQTRWRGVTVTLLPSRRRLPPRFGAWHLDDGTQAAVFAPHGLDVDAEHLAQIPGRSPCAVLATSCDRYALPAVLGGVASAGLASARALVDAFDPRVVVRSHDGKKKARGLVRHVARVQEHSDEALASLDWLSSRYRVIDHHNPVDL